MAAGPASVAMNEERLRELLGAAVPDTTLLPRLHLVVTGERALRAEAVLLRVRGGRWCARFRRPCSNSGRRALDAAFHNRGGDGDKPQQSARQHFATAGRCVLGCSLVLPKGRWSTRGCSATFDPPCFRPPRCGSPRTWTPTPQGSTSPWTMRRRKRFRRAWMGR